jgi:hypothetical protein
MDRLWIVLLGGASVGLVGAACAITVASRGFKFGPALFLFAGLAGLAAAIYFYKKEENDGEEVESE